MRSLVTTISSNSKYFKPIHLCQCRVQDESCTAALIVDIVLRTPHVDIDAVKAQIAHDLC